MDVVYCDRVFINILLFNVFVKLNRWEYFNVKKCKANETKCCETTIF